MFLRRTTNYLPWKILFETEQENPFHSRHTLAWFTLSSMFNHSCLPNCLWYLIGDYLFLYVISNVKQDEQLTISYCPLGISSLVERRNRLREYRIHCCQCELCHYDRRNENEYENDLKIFRNYRALARQKNLTEEKQEKYHQQLKEQFEYLQKKYSDRPQGFIQELLDFEKDKDFLQYLTTVCRIDLPNLTNPLFLFGKQMNSLIDYLEKSSSPSEDESIEQWQLLLDYLYEIYTFQSLSSSNEIFFDQKQLFTQLFQSQSYFLEENKF